MRTKSEKQQETIQEHCTNYNLTSIKTILKLTITAPVQFAPFQATFAQLLRASVADADLLALPWRFGRPFGQCSKSAPEARNRRETAQNHRQTARFNKQQQKRT